MEEYLKKKCAWFYDLEELFWDHTGVNPPLIVESGQPPRRDGQAVEGDLGGLDTASGENTTKEAVNEGKANTDGNEEEPQKEDSVAEHTDVNKKNNDYESDLLYSVISQLTREERRKEMSRVSLALDDSSTSDSEVYDAKTTTP